MNFFIIIILAFFNFTVTAFESNEISNHGFSYTNCTEYKEYSPKCDMNGICVSSGYCKCDDGYITWPENNAKGCNYKQKSKLIAFILSFIFGLESGAGGWYIENENIALMQLLVFILGIPFLCCFFCIGNEILLGTMTCIWFYVWIAILTGSIKDGNGAPLQDF